MQDVVDEGGKAEGVEEVHLGRSEHLVVETTVVLWVGVVGTVVVEKYVVFDQGLLGTCQFHLELLKG